MENSNPKTCHQHGESEGTTDACNKEDGIWSGRWVDIIWGWPPEDFFNGRMNSSRHLEDSD